MIQREGAPNKMVQRKQIAVVFWEPAEDHVTRERSEGWDEHMEDEELTEGLIMQGEFGCDYFILRELGSY